MNFMRRKDDNTLFYLLIFTVILSLNWTINSKSLFELIASLWWLWLGISIYFFDKIYKKYEAYKYINEKCEHNILGGKNNQKCKKCQENIEEEKSLRLTIQEKNFQKEKIKEKNENVRLKLLVEVLEWRKIQKEYYEKIDPFDFEIEIAKLFEKEGYISEVTSKVNDGGKDIILRKNNETIYVECKRLKHSSKVGRPVLQKLFGSMIADGVDKGIVVTTSRFSMEAIEFKKNLDFDIELIDGSELMLRLKNVYGNKKLPSTHVQYCSHETQNLLKNNSNFNATELRQEISKFTPSCGEKMEVTFSQNIVYCSKGHQNIAMGYSILNEEIRRFNPGVPLCKNCGSSMIKRKQKSSSKKFWGCSKYPKCSFTMNIK